MKAVHFNTDAISAYPMCSSGFGKGSSRRSRRQRFTLVPSEVTCKICIKMLAARRNVT
jgi:hypothetical protein